MDLYETIWERRHEILPTIAKSGVDNDWAKGRSKHLVFLVRINNDEIIERIEDAQRSLKSCSCFDPFPKEYFHMTVKPFGFLTDTKKFEDDVTEKELDETIHRAEVKLKAFSQISVTLNGLNIVQNVVFVQVYDENRLGEINKALLDIPNMQKLLKRDFPNFMSHVSIARFKAQEDFNGLVTSLEDFRNTKFGTLTIDTIETVIAHMDREYPEFETIHTYTL